MITITIIIIISDKNNNDNNNNNEMKNAWPRRKLLQKKNVQAQYISSNVPCNKSVKLQYDTRPFSNLIELIYVNKNKMWSQEKLCNFTCPLGFNLYV